MMSCEGKRYARFGLPILPGVLLACSSATPQISEYCRHVRLPRCPAATSTLDASTADRWGPLLNGKTIAIRGPLRLERWTCAHPPSIDPMEECRMIRSMRLAHIYVGSVAVRGFERCTCRTERGTCSPVLHPDVIVAGKYTYFGPRDPNNPLESVEDQPPPHMMAGVKICTAQ